MSTGLRLLTGKRLFFLLGGCCFMMSCQPQLREGISQQSISRDEPKRSAAAEAGATTEARSADSGGLPADWRIRAMTDAKRVDARTAQLAVSRVENSEGRSLLRVDSAMFGGADWAKAVLENTGLSVRQEDDVLLVESRGGSLRDALKRSLKPIHGAIDRVRGNLRKAELVGTRRTVGGLECAFETGAAIVAFRGDGERIDNSQGQIRKTARALDIAINGRGLFLVQGEIEGTQQTLYTRNGHLSVDAEGRLRVGVTGSMFLAGDLCIPRDAAELTIDAHGALAVRRNGHREPEKIGTLQLASFEHPDCLEEKLPGFYAWTPAAGKQTVGTPGEAGVGVIGQGMLEDSNVNIAESWAWLSLLEDARQLILTMAETIDTEEHARENRAVASIDSLSFVRGCDQTVVVRMPDPLFDASEPMLAKLLRIRGIDHWTSLGGVELSRSRVAAAALVEYLGILRTRLDVIAENIDGAYGPLPGQTRNKPYQRRIVRLDEDGNLAIIEDAAPFGVRWEMVPSLATGFAMPMLVESTNVSTETELEDSDRTTREYRAVREALAEMGREAVPALAVELSAERATACVDAAYVLAQIGRDAIGAVPALLGVLKSDDRSFRNAAADALMRIAPDSPLVVEGLLETLSASLVSDDWRVRREAVEALGRMGPRAAPCVPALAALLNEPSSGAALALAQIGSGAKPAAEALVAALSNPDPHIRMQSAYALGRIGVEAREALPALLAAMYDAEEDVRAQALAAVGQIGGDESGCIAALATVLHNENASVRRRVVAAMGPLGAWAKAFSTERPVIRASSLLRLTPTALEIIGFVRRPATPLAQVGIAVSLNTRTWRPLTHLVIAHLGWAERCDVDALIELAAGEDERVSAAAMDALGALGADAAAAVPMLSAALDHDSPWIRRAAAHALGRIGKPAGAAVPSLEAHLMNEAEQVATAAAVALGRIGSDASEAADTLQALSYHSSPTVRSAALEALNRLALSSNAAGSNAIVPQYSVAATAEPTTTY